MMTWVAALAMLAPTHGARTSAEAPEDTAALFKASCAICHEVPETKAPPTATLRQLPAAKILMAMQFGKMQPQAAVLEPEQRVRLASRQVRLSRSTQAEALYQLLVPRVAA
jgi:mono/diheme cytochrome c family protein